MIRKKRLISCLLAVLTAVMILPVGVSAENSLILTMTSDVTDSSAAYGDLITVTVSAAENDGFWGGTLYFDVSDNLEFDSATSFGTDVAVNKCLETDISKPTSAYYGFYGVTLMYDSKTEQYTGQGEICTVTFRVTGLGDIRICCTAYDVISVKGGIESVNVTDPEALEYTVKTPDKPVVSTETLPSAVLRKQFSKQLECDVSEKITWEVTDGVLPDGIKLSEDGLISGAPTVIGSYTFKVTATFIGSVVSDPKELTLTVLEKPNLLELKQESTYTEDRKSSFLRGVVENTTAKSLLASFENPDFIKILDAGGKELAPAALVGTGCKVTLNDTDDILTVIIKGDVNGDGEIGAFDYIKVRAHLLNTPLAGAALDAADVTGDTEIGAFDYIKIRSHIMGQSNIFGTVN